MGNVLKRLLQWNLFEAHREALLQLLGDRGIDLRKIASGVRRRRGHGFLPSFRGGRLLLDETAPRSGRGVVRLTTKRRGQGGKQEKSAKHGNLLCSRQDGIPDIAPIFARSVS